MRGKNLESVFSIKINDTIYKVNVGDVSQSPVIVNIGEERFEIEFEEHGIQGIRNIPSTIGKSNIQPASKDAGISAGGDKVITAPMPGKVLKINVKLGDSVANQQVVCVIEAMKMEQFIKTGYDGIVESIQVEIGQNVNNGTVILKLKG